VSEENSHATSTKATASRYNHQTRAVQATTAQMATGTRRTTSIIPLD